MCACIHLPMKIGAVLRFLSDGADVWHLLPGKLLVALRPSFSPGDHEHRGNGGAFDPDLRRKMLPEGLAHCPICGAGLDPLRHARDRRAHSAPSERSRDVSLRTPYGYKPRAHVLKPVCRPHKPAGFIPKSPAWRHPQLMHCMARLLHAVAFFLWPTAREGSQKRSSVANDCMSTNKTCDEPV